MDISTIFTFTIATALIVAIPGPTILMIVAAGVAGGRRAALGALFAILAADVILIALVASGLGVLAELGGATLDWLSRTSTNTPDNRVNSFYRNLAILGMRV